MNTAVIDFSPLINQVLIPLITSVLLALAGVAMAKVAAYAHIKVQDSQRDVLSAAITNGIAYAAGTLPKTAKCDAHVAEAVNYILPKVPGALKGLGVTPEHLAQLVTAQLSK